ncbi:hypothetical protein GCM10009117_07460 [Gangjinia marincola]|uniref:Uncharacterized protein n=1 Tax=Gangjinia marincola TaxID=578463 RepID=A0ABP3XQM3_9FLAO
MKHTNREVLGKGIKFMAMALPCIALGPMVLFSAFKNQDHALFIPVLGVGIFFFFLAIYLMFKGIRTILKSMFD